MPEDGEQTSPLNKIDRYAKAENAKALVTRVGCALVRVLGAAARARMKIAENAAKAAGDGRDEKALNTKALGRSVGARRILPVPDGATA